MISNSNIEVNFSPDEVKLKPLFGEDIAENYIKWLNDPKINQFLEVRHSLPVNRKDILDFIKKCEKIKRHHWGIFAKEEHVGNVSCSVYNHAYSWVDISILIGEEKCRGTGLGKLSVAGAVEHLFSVSGFHRVQAGAYANNIPSIRLFTGLGFNQECVLRESVIFEQQYIDSIKFGILDHEWRQITDNFPKANVCKMPWE